ncbi:MAG: nucleotidyltransferase family protein [Planctomycetes bacterium]|nr:nucleotidyltransferase family protein [Planctomycetota bacterium]
MIRRAVILAGGKGRRLYPYTACLPKPLVPVGDRPIVETLLLQLQRAGIDHVTFATGHLAELIMAFFGSGEKYGIRIDYAVEEKPLGTVGPLRRIDGLSECFFVLNGDLLTDVSFAELARFHQEQGTVLTVATYRKRIQVGLGVLETGPDHRVRRFQEKPNLEFDASMGIYVFDPRILQFIPEDRAMGFDELMAELLSRGEGIASYRHNGAWYDIGSPEDYQRAIEEFESNPGRFVPPCQGEGKSPLPLPTAGTPLAEQGSCQRPPPQ